MNKDIKFEFEGLLPDTIEFSLKEELSISEDIDSEIDRAAHKFGWYAVLAEKADTRYQKLDFAFNKWKSITKTNELKRRELEKNKKLTKEQMDDFIQSRPLFAAYQLKLIKYGDNKRILRSIAKAMDIRCSMVQTKAANRRKEH